MPPIIDNEMIADSHHYHPPCMLIQPCMNDNIKVSIYIVKKQQQQILTKIYLVRPPFCNSSDTPQMIENRNRPNSPCSSSVFERDHNAVLVSPLHSFDFIYFLDNL